MTLTRARRPQASISIDAALASLVGLVYLVTAAHRMDRPHVIGYALLSPLIGPAAALGLASAREAERRSEHADGVMHGVQSIRQGTGSVPTPSGGARSSPRLSSRRASKSPVRNRKSPRYSC